MSRRPPRPTRTDTLFPYTTLFRSEAPVIRLKAIGQLEAQALSVAYARLGEIGKPDQAKIGEIMLCCEVELGYDISDFGYEVAQVDLMLDMATDEPEEVPAVLEKQAVREEERRVGKTCVSPCRSWLSPFN